MKQNFSNQELLLIHDRFSEHIAVIETCAEKKFIIRTVEIPGVGAGATNYPINDEQAEALLQSEQYVCARSIVDKLHPIAEMIRESGIAEPQMLSDEIWKGTGVSDA